ncbi:hypothetical protein ALC53_12947, partial [Atta colombica]
HQKNLIDTIQIFLNNGYSLSFIFSTINNRIKYYIHSNNFTHKINTKHKDKFFSMLEDELEPLSNQNVAYKISCEDYDASYVGQTKRKLNNRSHFRYQKKNGFTIISDHCMNLNHNFKWNEVKILHKEASYNKRLISEMIHIKKQRQGNNKQNDIIAKTIPLNHTITFPFIITSLSQFSLSFFLFLPYLL